MIVLSKNSIRRGDSELELEWANPDLLKDVDYGSLPSTSTSVYDKLWAKLKEGSPGIPFVDIYNFLINLKDVGARISFQLNLQINKLSINEDIKTINKNTNQNIMCFLFPSSFLSIIRSISLETFENEFYRHGLRLIIPIFGFSGYLKGDFLTICGYDHLDELETELSGSLSNDVLDKAKKSLNLRQYHSLGSFPTRYLTPDVFSITVDKNSQTDEQTKDLISKQLNSFKAFFINFFLADYTEPISNGYQIEFMGRDQVSFP